MNEKSRKQLFNGNVREPLPIVLISSIVGVALLILACISTINAIPKPSKQTTRTIKANMDAFVLDGPIYIIYVDNLRLSLPSDALNSDELETLILNQNSILIDYAVDDNGENVLSDICCIKDVNGNDIVSASLITELSDIQKVRAQLILWSVAVCYWSLCISAYYILCNASRFPILASILVRKDFRNF